MKERKDCIIKLLDEITINQIAAGEVIEDSASCIKELVENALDAGATHIVIKSMGGGMESIEVSDNGIGMDEDELPMAILRHATSKIKKSEDLAELTTLGFRGEALASIASVSKVTITSCKEGQKVGTQVKIERGEIVDKKYVARTRGTTIQVHSLFYNVYARAAFQSSPSLLTQRIGSTLTHLALFKEGVAFEWTSEGKRRFFVASTATVKERIALLLGENFVKALLPIDFSQGSYRLYGFMGTLYSHRANRNHQHLFINGRTVTSPLVASSINKGYATRIPEKRYPPFVCNVQLLADEVDVNVHPQKKEVRFREKEKLEQFCIEAVNYLFEGNKVPKMAPFSFSQPHSFTMAPLSSSKVCIVEEEVKLPHIEEPSFQIVRLWGRYALIERKGAYFIDLSRASRFIISQKQSVFPTTQTLLFPFTYECSVKEAEAIAQNLSLLEEHGFSVRPFGNTSFIVDAVSTGYDVESTKELLENLSTEKKGSFIEKICAKVSQRSYTMEQASALIKVLFAFEGPYFLPGGKALLFELNNENLQKVFK